MEPIVADNYEHMSQIGADIIIRQLSQKPDSVLGLATGGTPLGVYKRLREQDKGLYSKVTTFNLDEYVGVMPNHPNSYHSYMRHELFDAVGLNEAITHVPDGMADNIETACLQYERRISESGGIDL
jgi:glucosamine-6-phosphate deaminase